MSTPTWAPRLRAAAPLALIAAWLALPGCGGGVGEVAGKVTYKGKPIVTGTVMIVGADGVPHYGAIAPDGTYRVRDVPVGSARVTVSSPNPDPAADDGRGGGRGGRDARGGRAAEAPPAPANPELSKGWVPIPDRYQDPSQTTLRVSVARGTNAYDIALE